MDLNPGPLISSQVLYQLSYLAPVFKPTRPFLLQIVSWPSLFRQYDIEMNLCLRGRILSIEGGMW